MSYQKYYENGWQNGQAGATPITAEALNHIEEGVAEVSAAVEHAVLVIDIPAFSSLPRTVNDSRITEDHELLRSELGTPSAQTGDWTVNTADGSVTVSGTMSGTTTLKLILGIPEHI